MRKMLKYRERTEHIPGKDQTGGAAVCQSSCCGRSFRMLGRYGCRWTWWKKAS